MLLLNQIVKLLSSPTWSGIGVIMSSLLAIIALLRTRKSRSNPDSSQLLPMPSTVAHTFHGQETSHWVDDDDPTGGVPDMFLSPSYRND